MKFVLNRTQYSTFILRSSQKSVVLSIRTHVQCIHFYHFNFFNFSLSLLLLFSVCSFLICCCSLYDFCELFEHFDIHRNLSKSFAFHAMKLITIIKIYVKPHGQMENKNSARMKKKNRSRKKNK